jgi:polyhydroxyalkanoate synthesis repressor PhaR
MKANRVIIRKYENRRLYDTTNSRYVNLDEVAAMLREGTEVQAVDARTGEDITRLLLTQIIVEGAKDHDSVLPLDVLRQMVMATGKASQESFIKYTRAIFEMYQSAYRGFLDSVPALDFLQVMTPAGTKPSEPGVSGARKEESEVVELRRRVKDLERLMASPGKKRKASRRRRKASG